MNKKEKSLLAAVVVGVGVAVFKYFTDRPKKQSIKSLFYLNDFSSISKNFSKEEIEREILKIYKEEINLDDKFKAILFLTMIEGIESLEKYNQMAQETLEEYVKQSSKKFLRINKKKKTGRNIYRENFYDLIEATCEPSSLKADIKLGIEECLNGNFKKGQDIFLSSTNSDKNTFVSLVICYFSDELEKLDKSAHKRHVKNALKDDKFLFLKSYIMDKNNMYKEQIDLLNSIEPQNELQENLRLQHLLINLIKTSDIENKNVNLVNEMIESFLSKKHETTNTVLNIIGISIEWSIINENIDFVKKISDMYLQGDIDTYVDCRLYVFTYLIVNFVEKLSEKNKQNFNFMHLNTDKVEILRKGIENNETYYKLYVYLGGETKDISVYKKALDICITKNEFINIMRILLVTETQNKILQSNK
ncbi:hypothetical protein EHP00_802 [Ecytonucleospora hepatopenaei]|uniref:Uncharacterized protein n=1 Tax=Ecytonucleospora hepatopenaei TaxID=646526 RepID=A0A1W0E7W8_9MICR|nr:hypothetical protein EHP00_802 [Ecytonucleospora hepatopenaei]